MQTKALIRTGRALAGREPFPLALRCRLTYRCQGRCRYCALPSLNVPELATDQWLAVFRAAAAAGAWRIAFDGGEPLLRPDIRDLAAAVIDLGMTLHVNSNSLEVPRHLDWLSRVSLVQLSLDGDRATHELSRPGIPYDAVIDAARLLSSRRVPVRFIFTITAATVEAVPAALQTAAELRVPILFQPVFPLRLSRGAAAVDDEPEKLRPAIEYLQREKRRSRWIANSSTALRYLRDWPRVPFRRCAAGWLFAVVEPDGSLVPCERIDGVPRLPWSPDLDLSAALRRLQGYSCAGCGFSGAYRLSRLLSVLPLRRKPADDEPER